MIVKSYAIYEYLKADEIKSSDANLILEELSKIHNLGYLHGDTQMKNFLKLENEILIIDSNLKRKRYGGVSENLEYLELAKNLEEIEKYINRRSISYKIAAMFFYGKKNFRQWKKKIRIKLGLRK